MNNQGLVIVDISTENLYLHIETEDGKIYTATMKFKEGEINTRLISKEEYLELIKPIL